MIKILCFLFLLFTGGLLTAQIMPGEGSRLNYRLIGFSFPCHDERAECSIEIARGRNDTVMLFDKNIISRLKCNGGKVIAEVPAFGSEYTWRIVVARPHDTVRSDLHHFSVGIGSCRDTMGNARMVVTNTTGRYKDNYIFVDATSTLYDMNGNAVWYLPLSKNENVRDLKISPQGTITSTLSEKIAEMDYNGDTLWKGPVKPTVSGDTSEHYHHEFTRLSNRHYMAFGREPVAWQLPFYKRDTAAKRYNHNIIKDSCADFYEKMMFGTMIEYNEKGDVVWCWKSSKYFRTSGLFATNASDGSFKAGDVHENSFFFDERHKVIYISFRDINTILKVKYPEGTVLATYGPMCKADAGNAEKIPFNGQHSCKMSKDGSLYLYNNNSWRYNDTPSIVMLREPAYATGSLQKVWEYKCTAEAREAFSQSRLQTAPDIPAKGPSLLFLTSGGNVMELADSSLFVSMGEPFSKLFIVGRDKNVRWRATLERKDRQNSKWVKMQTYRATIISHSQLERVIWNTQHAEKNTQPNSD